MDVDRKDETHQKTHPEKGASDYRHDPNTDGPSALHCNLR